MTFTTAELAFEGELTDFECGLESVDDWFRNRAWNARQFVATHVCKVGTDRVACFALRHVIVEVTDLPSLFRAGASNGQSIGILLAQMGVESAHQGAGYGKETVREAMRVAARIHAASPVQLFVVDAENEKLIPFYEGMGLRRIPNTFRLMAPMSRIVRALGAA